MHVHGQHNHATHFRNVQISVHIYMPEKPIVKPHYSVKITCTTITGHIICFMKTLFGGTRVEVLSINLKLLGTQSAHTKKQV